MKRRIFSAMLSTATLLAACAGTEVRHAAPTSAPEVVSVIQQIVDSDDLMRDEFYSEAALRRRFGDQPKIQIRAQGPGRGASIAGFGNAVDGKPTRPPAVPNVIYIDIDRSVSRSGPDVGEMTCILSASFVGFQAGMDFESIVARLGRGWHRDTKAETERFFAFTREPFNPPFPRPSAFMGNAIIVYGDGPHRLVLEFGADGILGRMQKPHANC